MKTQCTMKHLCILILAAFLLASCSGKEDIHQETEGNAESADMVSGKETEETRLSHVLPEDLSFDGGDFTFLGVGTGINFGYYSTTDLWVEGENGEVFNDAIFKRNNSVEELLDIAIRVIDFDDTTAEIKRNGTAGDPLYDAVWANGNASFNLSASGCFLDFHTIPYIHLEKPWWDQNIQSDYAFYGKNYVMTRDISTRDDASTVSACFNKDMIDEYSLPSPHQLVADGTWTFDRFSEMVQTVSVDVNGDGVMTDGDVFGLYGEQGAINRVYTSLGGTFYQIEADGSYTITVTDERNIDIYNGIFNLYSNDQSVPNIEKWVNKGPDGNVYSYARSVLFSNNKFLFVFTGPLCYEEFRDMESLFGIVPIPKFDETSDRYYAVVDEHAPLLSIPACISSPEKTGAVLEAMAWESMYTVTPEYNETLLKRKLSRDSESAEMLDIIATSRTYSVMAMTNWGGLYSVAGSAYNNGKTVSVSDFEKKLQTADTQMQKDLARFAALES